MSKRKKGLCRDTNCVQGHELFAGTRIVCRDTNWNIARDIRHPNFTTDENVLHHGNPERKLSRGTIKMFFFKENQSFKAYEKAMFLWLSCNILSTWMHEHTAVTGCIMWYQWYIPSSMHLIGGYITIMHVLTFAKSLIIRVSASCFT